MSRIFKMLINLYRRIFWAPEKLARYSGVVIGSGCDIQRVSFGSEPYLISIGNNVQITNDTKFFTHGAGWVLREKYPDMDFFGKIIIKDNVYIGNNCLILPGITIGCNVIVAAGSVVTKSIPDNSVVGGNPAKILSSLSVFESKMLQKNVKSKLMSASKKKNYLLSLPQERFIEK